MDEYGGSQPAQYLSKLPSDYSFPMASAYGGFIPVDPLWHGNGSLVYDYAEYAAVGHGNNPETGVPFSQPWPSDPTQPDTLSYLSAPEIDLYSATLFNFKQEHALHSVQDAFGSLHGSNGDSLSQVLHFPELSNRKSSVKDARSVSIEHRNSSMRYNAACSISFQIAPVKSSGFDADESPPNPAHNSVRTRLTLGSIEDVLLNAPSSDDTDVTKYYINEGDERPYYCAYRYTNDKGDAQNCDKAFASKYRVLRHYKSVHGDKSKHPWCEYCQRHYSEEYNFRAHLRRHNGPFGLRHLHG